MVVENLCFVRKVCKLIHINIQLQVETANLAEMFAYNLESCTFLFRIERTTSHKCLIDGKNMCLFE